MRKVIAGTTFVSLDGVMQGPGGPEEDPSGGFEQGGWTVNYWDDAMMQAQMELFGAPFDLLLGRKTYEIFAAHWPYHEGEIADPFNAATKYVATSSDKPLAWRNSVALRGDVPAEVARLKREDGPPLVIQGSSVLIQALLRAGLIDELRLMVFPLVLGNGKKLFGEDMIPAAFRLAESRTSTTGVLIARYAPDGAIETGSFAMEEPSEAELARREKMKQEELA